jgi:glycerol uptake facilitator-like aquaporin
MFKLNRSAAAPLTAEFLGTGVLVMIALILGQTTAVSYFIATSVAVAAVVVYMLFQSVSGAHTNPAITFGMWTARKMGTIRAITYIVAQLLGGLAAWQLFQYLTNHTLTAKTATFSTPVWLAEAVGAAVLAMAFSAAMSRKSDQLYSGLMIGAAYFVGIVIAATASAGYINPAVALGSRAWSAAYVLGPLAGGLIGVNLFVYLFGSPLTSSGASSGVNVRHTTLRKSRK